MNASLRRLGVLTLAAVALVSGEAMAREPIGRATDEFDESAVVQLLKRRDHVSALKKCYERELKRGAALWGGRIELSVSVRESGTVKNVSSNARADLDGVARCMRDDVSRWRFPHNSDDYEVTFPVIVQAPGPEPVPQAPPQPTEDPSRAVVRHAINAVMPKAEACFERGMEVPVSLILTVSARGTVTDVDVGVPWKHTPAAACLDRVARSIKFPRSAGETIWPVVFESPVSAKP